MARSNKPGGKPDVQNLLARLAEVEQTFLEREFFAPAVTRGTVQVRIGGVVCKLAVEPQEFRGYGVFRPTSHTQARLVRPATLAERRQYLSLFPQVRLILCRQSRGTWYGCAASFGDHRIELEGLAPILLVEEAQPLETVCARFDGSSFWFEEIDPRQDPATPPYLRAALADRALPEQLDRKGLTAEQRAAYELLHWEQCRPHAPREEIHHAERDDYTRRRGQEPPVEVDPVRQRLQENLSHAGAQLVDYLERGDSFRVTYLVGNQRYTSAVDKRDLSVQIAGICLSGEDQKFDLASLVGVLYEGTGHGAVRVGDDDYALDEEQYSRTSAKTVVERCWILVGRRQGAFWHARRIRATRGQPASVAFDGGWVLEREERNADVVGFYHTHPGGPAKPSDRDLRTMRAWVSSFGKPLSCLIESDGKLAAYRFDNDRSRGTLLPACERLPRNLVIAYDPTAHDTQ